MTAVAGSIQERPTNHTAGHHVVLPGQAPDGQPILSVLLKRTYNIVYSSRCARAAKDNKLIPGDVHYDGPTNSPVRYEADFVPFKLATDVVLNGKAYAPDGKGVTRLVASIQVGDVRKQVAVIGDRVAKFQGAKRTPVFTDPLPFREMDLGYDRAFGGVDIYSDTKVAAMYPRNHLGRGYVVANTAKTVEGLPLPNLEDPGDLLTPERLCVSHFKDWERQPMPHTFGWVAKFWRPRSLLAGVMPGDRATERTLRQAFETLVPPAQKEMYAQTQLPDMDFNFFNGASTGLGLPFLQGNETVKLLHLSLNPEVWFELPGERPRIGLDLGEGVQEPPVVLHTVMISLDTAQVDLVWRGAVPFRGPDWLPEMRKMDVTIV